MNVHHRRAFAIFVGIVMIPAVQARAGEYSFSRIVDSDSFGPATAGTTVLSDQSLGLNNNGTAVFATYNRSINATASDTRIYTANAGGPLNLIVAEGSSPNGQDTQYLGSFGYGASINDSGVVAYWKETSVFNAGYVTQGIYRSDGTTIYEATVSNSQPLMPQMATAINNSGEVAFFVDNHMDAEHLQQALMKGNGSTLVTVASVSSGGFSSINDSDGNVCTINSAGAVAFTAYGPAPLTSGVYVGSGGPLTT